MSLSLKKIAISALERVAAPAVPAMSGKTGSAGGTSLFDLGAGYAPPLRSADADILPGMDGAKAVARDLAQNNPFAKNAARIQRDSVVGVGFKLSLKPDHETLGLSPEEANLWARKVERQWELFAASRSKSIDVARVQNFHQLMQTLQASLFVNGEALATVGWRTPPLGESVGTCFQVIEPDRLSTPADRAHNTKIRKGVERNHWGEPVAYYIQQAHPADVGLEDGMRSFKWKRIRRRTSYGRLNVIHVFDRDRPEMTRGLTDFVTALRPLKALEKYQDTALERAIIQSVFAAAVKTNLNYDQAFAAMGADKFRGGKNPLTAMAIDHMSQIAPFHKKAGFGMSGAQMVHLLPNEEVELFRSEAADTGFADFEKAVLRQIAAGTGAPITALSQNYADVNYSAARAALQDVWRHYLSRRELLITDAAWPMFGAWLEEAVARGSVELPAGVDDFYEAREALMRGRFFSWGKPVIDPVKEAKGDQIELQMGTSTLEEICATKGRDWRDVIDQRAVEVEYMLKKGLDPWEVNPDLLFSQGPDDQGGDQSNKKNKEQDTIEGEGVDDS